MQNEDSTLDTCIQYLRWPDEDLISSRFLGFEPDDFPPSKADATTGNSNTQKKTLKLLQF